MYVLVYILLQGKHQNFDYHHLHLTTDQIAAIQLYTTNVQIRICIENCSNLGSKN